MILRPATLDDCQVLAANLRERDLQEIALGSGRSPLDAVEDAWGASYVRHAIVTPSGELAGIWGVATNYGPLQGLIWMLGTDALSTIPMSFLRACKPAIASAQARHAELVCAPWRENELHLRWLRWLGFTIQEVGHPHFLKATRHV